MKQLLIVMGLLLIITSQGNAACISGNCRNGQGTFLFDGGNKYTGQFKNGLQNGQGTHTYVNGGRYVGQWKDGKYHGHGVFTKNNGETYQAIDGKRVGHVGAKARLAKANRAENLRIWSFLALISPVWGLIICFFRPCSIKRMISFIVMTLVGGFIAFFIAFAANGGAAGSSEMSLFSWICLLIYLAFYYPFLAKFLLNQKKKNPESNNLCG